MKHMRLIFTCALLALSRAALAETPPAATNAVFASYGMITVDSAETVAALQRLIGEDTRLVYDKGSGRLLVFGPPAAHLLIRDALRTANLPPRNIRIDVTFAENRTATTLGGSEQTVAHTQQQLLVASGSEAALHIGETVPFINELITWGYNHGMIIAREVTLRRVGASLVVRAHVIGEGPLVQLTLTPELSGVYTQQGDRMRFSEVATTLTVRSGEAVTLAAFEEHTEFYQLFLAGLAHGRMRAEQQIILRVTLDAPAMQP